MRRDLAGIILVAAVGLGGILRGAAYIDPPSTGLTNIVDQIVPLSVWAAVWLGTGLVTLVSAFFPRLRNTTMSFSAGLWLVWGLSYMHSTVFGDSSRGWVTGSTFLLVAGLIYGVAYLLARQCALSKEGK